MRGWTLNDEHWTRLAQVQDRRPWSCGGLEQGGGMWGGGWLSLHGAWVHEVRWHWGSKVPSWKMLYFTLELHWHCGRRMGGVAGPQLPKADIFSLGLSIYEVARLQRYLFCARSSTHLQKPALLYNKLPLRLPVNSDEGSDFSSLREGRLATIADYPKDLMVLLRTLTQLEPSSRPSADRSLLLFIATLLTRRCPGCSRILHLTHLQSSRCPSWRGNLRRRGRR